MAHFIGPNVLFQRHFLILKLLRICPTAHSREFAILTTCSRESLRTHFIGETDTIILIRQTRYSKNLGGSFGSPQYITAIRPNLFGYKELLSQPIVMCLTPVSPFVELFQFLMSPEELPWVLEGKEGEIKTESQRYCSHRCKSFEARNKNVPIPPRDGTILGCDSIDFLQSGAILGQFLGDLLSSSINLQGISSR